MASSAGSASLIQSSRMPSTSAAERNGGGGKPRFAPAAKDDYQEERSRILTMKYGKQQMMLIRKRLSVEMWLMNSLEKLYGPDTDAASYQSDVDIDELLDLEDDKERRNWLKDYLNGCQASPEEIQVFIDELLVQLKTL